MAEETDDVEYDILLTPPAPAVVSDEEEANYDNLVSTTLPNDVPGTIEVIPRRPNYDVSDWDDSDDEPILNFKPAAKRAKVNNSGEPVWKKISPTYSKSHSVTDTILLRGKNVLDSLKDHNAINLFEKICNDDVMDLITENSALYAAQNNRHNFNIDAADLKKFLGILILSGYHELPTERAYWSLDEDLGVPLIAN
ncbi:PREDICTED: uncharacterized protein LOC108356906, partial [Rhagoletis zephyria]|uniref:uncharacterized protein LOC108356906 n=1 Tax=Rhagoletis zephyria TaxID=28612 RepID=UPI000811814C